MIPFIWNVQKRESIEIENNNGFVGLGLEGDGERLRMGMEFLLGQLKYSQIDFYYIKTFY